MVSGAYCSSKFGAAFRSWFATVVLVFLVALKSSAGDQMTFSFDRPSTFKIGKKSFHLEIESDVLALGRRAEEILSAAPAELEGRIRKRDARGLKEIARLASQYAGEKERESRTGSVSSPRLLPGREVLRLQILEIADALSNNHRSPVPAYVGLPDLPFRLAAALHNPVGRGHKPAANIVSNGRADLSVIDPDRSSYWVRPDNIAESDLHAGFGRTELPRFDHALWNYAGAKKGGGNPGCELAGTSRRIKVKFAETHSEPFIGRIFHALGYHVDATDYAPGVRIRYDRRFFTEFNTRPQIKMKIGVLFIPVYTFHFEQKYDPFSYLDHAVMKDGRTVPGSGLKALLLRNPKQKQAADPENFRPEVEAQIDFLVTTKANVQVEQTGTKNIGPWDFGGLGREHLREVRGAGVLAAWLGWWDSRYENTRLRLVKTGRGEELRHFFADLGSGMGHSGGTFRHSSEEPNDFTWTFTQGGPGRRAGADRHFEIINFEPITETAAFKQITRDDARWMGRLIAQLSEDQIVSALIASGFNSAEVRIYTEKLLARRDRLVRDAGLENEIALLRPEGPQRKINYDPVAEGPVRVRNRNGTEVQALIGANLLRDGRVEARR
jgi:hypothetical protein